MYDSFDQENNILILHMDLIKNQIKEYSEFIECLINYFCFCLNCKANSIYFDWKGLESRNEYDVRIICFGASTIRQAPWFLLIQKIKLLKKTK